MSKLSSPDKHEITFKDPFVNFYVRDVESSSAFYREFFGFKETLRTQKNGVPDHIELLLGNFTLGFTSYDTADKVHGIAKMNAPARADILFLTENVDEAFAHLESRGVRVVSPPHDYIGTLRSAWFSDPDGNNIQIVTDQSTEYGFQVHTRIRKPVADVFDAVINPDKASIYFATGGVSGYMKEGSIVSWEFEGISEIHLMTVTKLVSNSEIWINWSHGDGEKSEVQIKFEELTPQETLVTIKHSGYRKDESQLRESYLHCEGWTVLLSSLKAYLEYGISIGKGYW